MQQLKEALNNIADTEKEFYLALLEFLCNKYSATFSRSVNATTMDIDYIISFGNQEY